MLRLSARHASTDGGPPWLVSFLAAVTRERRPGRTPPDSED